MSGNGIELSVLKKSEKEDCWIVRVVETKGTNSKGKVTLSGLITECNLIEWDNIRETVNVNNDLDLDLTPFEIKTFKIHQLKLD